jgi:hypothetical protein
LKFAPSATPAKIVAAEFFRKFLLAANDPSAAFYVDFGRVAFAAFAPVLKKILLRPDFCYARRFS